MEPDSTPESRMLQQVRAGDFSNLLAICDDLELAVQEELSDTLTPERADQMGVLYVVHLMACLLEGRTNAASTLLKRIPEPVVQHAQVVIVQRLLTAWSLGEQTEFFKLIDDSPWETQVQPLVSEVVKRSRYQFLQKIGEAYKVIPVDRVALILGLDAIGARAACEAHGWAIDATGNVFPIQAKTAEKFIEMGDAPLKKLAEYVAYLEQPCRS